MHNLSYLSDITESLAPYFVDLDSIWQDLKSCFFFIFGQNYDHLLISADWLSTKYICATMAGAMDSIMWVQNDFVRLFLLSRK